MDTMKRPILIVLCIALTTFVTGCDLMTYIWQHIIGHGYNQVTWDTIKAKDNEGRLVASSINGSLLPQNTVVVYKTRRGFYGKLAMLAAPSSSFNFQFTTYTADGSAALSSSSNITVTNLGNCDLEASGGDPNASPAASEFQWGTNVLTPQGSPNTALFYILP